MHATRANRPTPLAAQVVAIQPSRRNVHSFALITSLVLLTGLCYSLSALAQDNPFSLSYQAQNKAGLRSMQAAPTPEIFMGKQREDDNISMLENGYDLMGLSGFESEEVSPDLALAQARAIQADTVLVYLKKAGTPTPAAKMEVIKEATRKGKLLTEKDVAADPKKYIYYASYWAKLPPSILGVHVIKLVPKKDLDQEEKQEAKLESEGVRVIAVIHGSAAEKAGLQRGDQLLTIQANQTAEKINDAANLSAVVRRLKGQAVTLQIKRGEAAMQLPAQL